MDKLLADRGDLIVTREDSVVRKTALTDVGRAELRNEARFVRSLSGTGFAPELRDQADDWLVLEDVGDGEPVVDEGLFLDNCVRLLFTFRRLGIKHGDLTSRNVHIRNDVPIALDFGQSTMAGDGKSTKRLGSDAYWFWHAVHGLYPARQVARWLAIREDLGNWQSLEGRTVLDLGCYEGQTVAMAAAEGATAVGVDRDPQALQAARRTWGRHGVRFVLGDLLRSAERAEIVFLLSTLSYVLRDHGLADAQILMERVTAQSEVLFLEVHLTGDGPGKLFDCDDDVHEWLELFGPTKKLTALPVAGRKASRSLWSVR